MDNKKLKTSPIPSTPILKGQDLVNLINDLEKPDIGKARRLKGKEILRKISKKGK